MALSKRKRRSVPRRIGEVNPPGIFSKAKCVFVSLTGSEYHHANRAQPDAATRTSSQSTRSVVDKASRRADQLEPVYCLLRTCAMPTHHALVPLHVLRSLGSAATGKDCRARLLVGSYPKTLGRSRSSRPVGVSCRIRARRRYG